MGGLNTKIPGDPGSVEAAASWLRSVEDKVSGARGSIRNAQGTAQHSWQGVPAMPSARAWALRTVRSAISAPASQAMHEHATTTLPTCARPNLE